MRTVPFTPSGCVLHKSHRPTPSRLEKHHVLPLYLAKRVGASSTKTVLVCEGGHTDIHVAINAMLLRAPLPRGVGTNERKFARMGLSLFAQAGGTVPL